MSERIAVADAQLDNVSDNIPKLETLRDNENLIDDLNQRKEALNEINKQLDREPVQSLLDSNRGAADSIKDIAVNYKVDVGLNEEGEEMDKS